MLNYECYQSVCFCDFSIALPKSTDAGEEVDD